uniref:Glutaredoxin (thioltransferase) n=1 Tax=Hucho hucho TaxID=62062 RepID=A0A4W5LD95_9TELE
MGQFISQYKAFLIPEFVTPRIKGDKVVVFLKPSCPYCVMAKDTSLDEMTSEIQDYLNKITGARTVPRVYIGKKCVGGGSDIKALDKSGKLEGMLKSIGSLSQSQWCPASR